ncbi:DUF3417 domain-containing protein [Oceanotoga sp. DSM 15011]|nr:DUF3417 domain-containing protein [Oceanotoga sp. DSM 15011]UYP00324.1 DUF3417 domain-containing protein [Oceanotoga sp. DSM 15011]
MKFLNKVTAVAKLPERISGLKEISKNLWWTWNYDCQTLFEDIDKVLWEKTNHNPVIFLKQVNQKSLDKVVSNDSF